MRTVILVINFLFSAFFSAQSFSDTCLKETEEYKLTANMLKSVGFDKKDHSKKVLNEALASIHETCVKEAQSGIPMSQYLVAQQFYYGEGIEKSINDASYWYLLSAHGGIDGAKVMLGNMFLNGEVFAKNYSNAYYWFLKARGKDEKRSKDFCAQFDDHINNVEMKRIEDIVKKEFSLKAIEGCAFSTK